MCERERERESVCVCTYVRKDQVYAHAWNGIQSSGVHSISVIPCTCAKRIQNLGMEFVINFAASSNYVMYLSHDSHEPKHS